MDSNGSRFHLLLGRDDWARCLTVGGERALAAIGQVHWDHTRDELTLWREAFRFPVLPGERPVTLEDRRGAAGDRFGNWYWIAPDRRSILVHSAGSRATSTFWPPVRATRPPAEGAEFVSAEPPSTPEHELQGLAITEDHYLVAGTLDPGGLLVFDLYSGGAPRERRWPFAFAPFDIAPRHDGGVWILERDARRAWELDRRFAVVTPARSEALPAPPEAFASAEGGSADVVPPIVRVLEEHAWSIPASDPIAITALDDGVLVLERAGSDGFARVHWLVQGSPRGTPASTQSMQRHIDEAESGRAFTLVAHDFTLGDPEDDDPASWSGRLYVVSSEGNQAFAFGVSTVSGQLSLEPLANYYPIRLFGGRALVSADGQPWYDCGDAWVRLLEQSRPRYADAGELWTPVFDSGLPGCTWHRLMLDGCIPAGAGITVYTRASDDWRDLTLIEWLDDVEREALSAPSVREPGDPVAEEDLAPWSPEPQPYLRGDGSELPFARQQSGPNRGTFELLFQRARGRYLQIKLVLHGNGRNSPRLRALRAWYPRFSYLERYLPAVYRDDPESASFLDRFLANIEGTFTAIEDRVAVAQLLFDAETAPPETTSWLAEWFGVALDPRWEDHRRRLFLRHAPEFFAMRGTVRGVQVALRLALDECVDDRIFGTGRAAQRAAPVRIVERFRSRRTARAFLGDVDIKVPGSTAAEQTPTRYFAAGEGERERVLWQRFLARRYRTLSALNSAWHSSWKAFREVPLPDRAPVEPATLADWAQFDRVVLAMHRLAHRFTVMLPIPKRLRSDSPAQQRRLALARSVLELEKPAHTQFDVRYYWAMFRVGEARLGDDTLIDLGSRSPELMPPMVLGENYLSEAHLSAHPGEDAPERMQLGRDRIDYSARIGGP